jgi:hypothetical protein
MLRTFFEQLLGPEGLACLHVRYARLDVAIQFRRTIPAHESLDHPLWQSFNFTYFPVQNNTGG